MNSTALPAWKYRNPETICDGLIAETKRREAAEKKRLEMALKHNRRRVKMLVKNAKRNGGSRAI